MTKNDQNRRSGILQTRLLHLLALLAFCLSGSVALAQDGIVAKPFPIAPEVAILTAACLMEATTGQRPDMQAHGYRFYRGMSPFFNKGVSRDASPSAFRKGDLAGASLNLDTRRSCSFSVSALGGRGSEQPFMREVSRLTEKAIRRAGYKKRIYTTVRNKQMILWVRGNVGVTLYISGQAGKETAKAALSKALDKWVAASVPAS